MSQFLFISSKQNRLWAFTQHSCALGRSFLSELDAPLSSSVNLFSSRIISQPAGFSLLPRCQWFAARPLAGEVRWGHSSLCKTCLSDERKKERERRMRRKRMREILNGVDVWSGRAHIKMFTLGVQLMSSVILCWLSLQLMNKSFGL